MVESSSLFGKLTKLFRSGPTVRRAVKSEMPRSASSAVDVFKKAHSNVYNATISAYGSFDRMSRYSDFSEMEATAEICSALDIYAEETVSPDEQGNVLHIYSDNRKVHELLQNLFYDVLNVEFNLVMWVRNLPVHKDTIIPLLDGTDVTIESIAKRMQEEPEWQPWVHSVQDGTNRTVPGRVNWCGLTRKDSQIVRVWLDDGSYLDCTPDHRFTMRNGTAKEAQHLQSGESLMPFYRKISNRADGAAMDGYEQVYDARINRYVYTHRRVAEVLKEGVLKNGRHMVTHHIDFNKRNNDPSNLVRMDEREHFELHASNAIKLLHTPEVTKKRMIGIDRWLRSDRHKEFAREQLRKLQEAGLMKTSWSDYNSSPQAKQDNFKRSELKKEMWQDSDRRQSAQANMTIKFDKHCVDLIVEQLANLGKYVSPKVLGNQLKADAAFMSHFNAINQGTNRDLTKPLKSRSGIESLLSKFGYSSYLSFVKERLPDIASTPWFKRAERKSSRLKGIVPSMQNLRHPNCEKENFAVMNHKVERIEWIEETSDVYCMEVLGPNGEHDRHRFMTLSNRILDNGEIVKNDSGVCLENCKYGDFFLFNDIHPDYGIINAFPISISEIEREEGFDPNDPAAVRFRWITQGNQLLENWQVTHFRMLGNDAFLPYGSSVLEGARRIWRQLILIEDAMLVYRVIRAPERRVFYIDVGNVPPDEVANYLEQVQTSLKRNQIVDKKTGKVDLRYNPLSVEEDFFLPVRGGESGTKIDTLAGGQNTAAIEDVQYIQKKLFAALKIPKAYLGYDEDIGSKATLSQEDIRFSRTIQRIQKTVVSELNKLAQIHLYCHGFEGEDLADFELHLSNPSTVAQMQKLELIRAKFEIAGQAPEGSVNRAWIQKNVLGLTDADIEEIHVGRIRDKKKDLEIESITGEPVEESGGDLGGGGGGGSLFGDMGGGSEPAEAEPAAETGGEESPAERNRKDGALLTAFPPRNDDGKHSYSNEDIEEDSEIDLSRLSIMDSNAPLKADAAIRLTSRSANFEENKVFSNDSVFPNTKRKRVRKNHGGRWRNRVSMPDHASMTMPKGRDSVTDDPYGRTTAPAKLMDSASHSPPKLTFDLVKTLGRMSGMLGKSAVGNRLLTESEGEGDPDGEA